VVDNALLNFLPGGPAMILASLASFLLRPVPCFT